MSDEFSLDKWKPLLKRLVFDVAEEMGVNIRPDARVAELTKGTADQSIVAYAHLLHIHTHPFALQESRHSRYNPPSNADFRENLLSYGRGVPEIVIAPEGMWTLEPTQKLQTLFQNDVPPFPHFDLMTPNQEGEIAKPTKLARWATDAEEDKLFGILKVIESNTGNYDAALAQDDETRLRAKDLRFLREISVAQYVASVESVVDENSGIGFHVALTSWDEPWTISLPWNARAVADQNQDVATKSMENRNNSIQATDWISDAAFARLKERIDATRPFYVVKPPKHDTVQLTRSFLERRRDILLTRGSKTTLELLKEFDYIWPKWFT